MSTLTASSEKLPARDLSLLGERLMLGSEEPFSFGGGLTVPHDLP